MADDLAAQVEQLTAAVGALTNLVAEQQRELTETNETIAWLMQVDDSIGEIGQRLRRRLGAVEKPQTVERVRVGDKVMRRAKRA